MEVKDETNFNDNKETKIEAQEPSVARVKNEAKPKDHEVNEKPINFDGINSGPAVRKISRETRYRSIKKF